MQATIRRYFLTLLSLSFAGVLSLWSQNSTPVHVVQAGETLYRISQIHAVTLDELYRLNPSAQNGIQPGQSIVLPISAKNVTNYATQPQAPQSVSPGRGDYRFHTVRSGDTLYSIARAYGVTVDEILSANSTVKAAESLSEGIILRIPPASRATASQAPKEGQKSEVTSPFRGAGDLGASSPQRPPVKPTEKVTGLKLITVESGMTIYSLLRLTGWSEEDLYKYNPRVRDGLKTGMTIFVPDMKLPDNKAVTNSTPLAYPDDAGHSDHSGIPNVLSGATVVLALPFAEDGNNTRFRDYYQGFLLKLREAKAKGISIDLYTVDVSSGSLSSSIAEIDAIPTVDLIIGGVSTASQTALAQVAKRKGALYTIPFTSTPLDANTGGRVYQINTPHVRLYAAAADKFVQAYSGGALHVHFVTYSATAKEDKSAFVSELKRTLVRNGIPYSEGTAAALDSDLAALRSRSGSVVVVPSSASRSAADLTLKALVDAMEPGEDEVYTGPRFTAFGYPEWQTYVSRIRTNLRKTESTFYTTFFTDPSSSDYRSFQEEYITWYGISVGNTFPRYSILGYDTAGYFLDPSSVGNIYKNGRYDGYYDGIQSRFNFRPSPMIDNLYSNMGVFFVRYQKESNNTLKL